MRTPKDRHLARECLALVTADESERVFRMHLLSRGAVGRRTARPVMGIDRLKRTNLIDAQICVRADFAPYDWHLLCDCRHDTRLPTVATIRACPYLLLPTSGNLVRSRRSDRLSFAIWDGARTFGQCIGWGSTGARLWCLSNGL